MSNFAAQNFERQLVIVVSRETNVVYDKRRI